MQSRPAYVRLILAAITVTAGCFGWAATSTAAEIEPLLTTRWGQRGLYAEYAPNKQRLGCWSVALAQMLYYHRVQSMGEVAYEGRGYRIKEVLDHRFDWDLFADAVTELTPPRNQTEVARYCYYAAIAIGKDFVEEAAYHGNSDVRRKGIAEHFNCTTRRYRTDVEGWEAVREIILSELAERRPLLLYAEPHAFVIDGARGDGADFEVHLNCGWGGDDDGWYVFERPYKTSRGLMGGTDRWVMTLHPPEQPKTQPANAPASTSPVVDADESRSWRTWTTADGRFNVDARLVRLSSDIATLEKRNGTTVDVSLGILSTDDQDFIRKQSRTDSVDER